MVVTFIFCDYIKELVLPQKKEGIFTISTNNNEELISIENDESNWIIYKSDKYRLLDDNECELDSLILKENTINVVEIDGEIGLLYVEEDNVSRKKFSKYYLDNTNTITIGKDKDNIISYDNKFVSRRHAVLKFLDGKWTIKDEDSVNGTFANNRLVESKELDFGDIIYIMGLKIIVFNNFFVVNNPNGKVIVSEDIFKKSIAIRNEKIKKKDVPFSRSPRLKNDIKVLNLEIDSPPNKKETQKAPLILSLGPSVTMGIVTVVFSTFNPIISAVSLICTIAWPIIIRKYDKTVNTKYETLRLKKYTEYLEKIEKEIDSEKDKQKKILNDNYAGLNELENRIINRNRALWEREVFKQDFLNIRVGIGNMNMAIAKKFQEKKFSLIDDALIDKLDALGKKNEILENVPISVSFYKNMISGVIGDKDLIYEFANNLVISLSSLYSYDEVKFIFIYKDDRFNYTKWLPHTISCDGTFRFIATNNDEVKEISYYLSEDIQTRLDNNKNDNDLPYYIVFNLDKELSLRADFINNIYGTDKNISFSVINFYNSIEELPKECTTIIEVNEDESRILTKTESSYDVTSFKFDDRLEHDVNYLAKLLANISLAGNDSAYELPTSLSILDMYKVGKIEKLNIINKWKENDIVKSLKVPIGVDKYGGMFYLDLHEKFHGPHGLVAGTTGSGKSEFIMTYILSLAINYSPLEVSFILIDYKGGGMAKSFELLPHVAGIITNIDKSDVTRAIISIHSELKRRETLIANAKEIVGESNIDIYKYQKYYREGKLKEPLSHLFIISDEFAELKNQEPEFMDELISTARIGRSLGVHLILATQKPSGVVSDQIWSNSKFRVCLKVQDVADSNEMLKRPEAASLKNVGRFYLQVGNNELFEIGQSAYGGVDYFPKNRVETENDTFVEVVDNNLSVVNKMKIDNNLQKSSGKQLDSIVKYISKICQENNIYSKKIWQDKMESVLLIDDLKKKYKYDEKSFYINPLVGVYDDLENQTNKPLRIPITDKGNLLVYGSISSDKSKFLSTLIYSNMTTYKSSELNQYILDFDTETSIMYKNLPTIAEVLLKDDDDKIINLFGNLKKEMEKRKKIISNYGVDFKEFINSKSDKSFPNILVIINNYAVFKELYDSLDDDLALISRDGAKFGIYFVISLSNESEMRFRINQNFAQKIALQFYDESNYYGILGKTNISPMQIDGRGLVKINNVIYEFQTATITDQENNCDKVKKVGNDLLDGKSNDTTSLIKVLPKKITGEYLKDYVNDKLNVPIGINVDNFNTSYFNIENNYINVVTAYNQNDINSFYENFYSFIRDAYNIEIDVIDIKNYSDTIKPVLDEIVSRHKLFKNLKEDDKNKNMPKKKLIFIKNIRDIIDDASKEKVDELEAFLEFGSKSYNVNIVIFDELFKLNSVEYRKWFKNVNRKSVLWIGNDFKEQEIFTCNSNINFKVSDGYAVLINGGEAEVTKLITNGGEVI